MINASCWVEPRHMFLTCFQYQQKYRFLQELEAYGRFFERIERIMYGKKYVNMNLYTYQLVYTDNRFYTGFTLILLIVLHKNNYLYSI